MPLLPSGPVQNWRVSAARKGSETPRVFSEAGSEQPQTAVYPGGPLEAAGSESVQNAPAFVCALGPYPSVRRRRSQPTGPVAGVSCFVV